jgi:hypothetical protein
MKAEVIKQLETDHVATISFEALDALNPPFNLFQ